MERMKFRIERISEKINAIKKEFKYFEIDLNENIKLIINQFADNSIEIDGCVFKSDFDLFNHAMHYAQNIIEGKFKVPDDCKSVDIVIEHGKKDTVIVNK